MVQPTRKKSDQKKCSVYKLAVFIFSSLLARLSFAGSVWGRGTQLLPSSYRAGPLSLVSEKDVVDM